MNHQLIGEKMTSKEDLIRKYKEYKDKHQAIPKLRDFCKFARHLQHQLRAIALIFDIPSEDNFGNFVSLVDAYLNKETKTVEIIKKWSNAKT